MMPSSRWWAASSHEVVIVNGPDASSFLEGQLSQEIASIEEGRGAWTLLLEPDGMLGHLLGISHLSGGRFALLPGPDRAAEVATRLRRFVLRSKVEIEIGSLRVAEISDDDAAVLGARLPSALGMPCTRVIEATGLEPDEEVSAAAVKEWRLERGSADEHEGIAGIVPLALGEQVVDSAASFTKGCYTGQELVARTVSRSAPPPVRVVRFQANHSVEPEEELHQGDDSVGHVIEAAWVATRSVGFAAIARRALRSDGEAVLSRLGPIDIST